MTATSKGMRIQVKDGYLADGAEPERQDAAIESPLDASGIGLHATVSLETVATQVDASDVFLVHHRGAYTGQLDLTVVSYTSDGRESVSRPGSIAVKLTDAEYAKAVSDGISIGAFAISSDAVNSVRIIVRDRGSNAVGSLTVPLHQGR